VSHVSCLTHLFYLHVYIPPRRLHSFPTRRSSDLASVSCIFGLGSPMEYQKQVVSLRKEMEISRDELLHALIDIQFERNDIDFQRSEEHTSELQSRFDLVCRLLLENKKNYIYNISI